ncbi:MAG TPA: S24 family peptidase [Thermoanaerobaculia bacterium]|jgi:transcriptional regulator with XRE-family HTH domain|nr:S24 family peptidase [Thermoanaerobaculia bacterium]
MTIGERLRRALRRTALSQRDIATRAGLEEATVSDLLNGKTQRPYHDTVERVRAAIGVTYSELYDEPRLLLSHADSELAHSFHSFLGRLLANDAAQKELTGREESAPLAGVRRRDRAAFIRESEGEVGPHEVEDLPNEPIPEVYVRLNARRAFRVATDTMIEAGIMEGSVLFVRPTVDVAAADGEIIVCRLNGRRHLKRLDLRGSEKVLRSANPRYDPIHIDEKHDRFAMIGVVCMEK